MSIVDELFDRYESSDDIEMYDDEVAELLGEPISYEDAYETYDDDFEVEDDEWR